jgi:hypothetical protein
MQWSANKKFDEDNAYLHKIASELVEKRRANPTDKNDLLNAMINGKDPVMGKPLSEETIIDNMITFLIAGTEEPLHKQDCVIIPSTDQKLLPQGTRLRLACCLSCLHSCCNIPRPTVSCSKRLTP